MDPMFIDDSGHARKRPVEHIHLLDERGYGHKVSVQSVPSFNLLQPAATNFPKTTVDSFGRTPYMKSLQVNGSHVREAREPQRMDLRLVRYDGDDERVRLRQHERVDVDLEYHHSLLSSTNNLTEVENAFHSSRPRQGYTKKSLSQNTGSVGCTLSNEPFGEPVDIRISLQQEQFARRAAPFDGSVDAVVGVRSRSSDSCMPQPSDWTLANERDGVPARRLHSSGDHSVVDGVHKKASRINRLKLKHPDGLNKLQQTIELQRQKASSSKENSCNSSALSNSQIDDNTFVKKVHAEKRQFDDLIINESVQENWRTGIREVTNSASGLAIMSLSSQGVKSDQQGSSVGGNQTYEPRQQGDLISCQPIARRVEHRSSDPVILKTYSHQPATATDVKVSVATSHRKIASTAQLHNEQTYLPVEKKTSLSHIVKRDANSRPKVGHYSTSDIDNKRSQTLLKSQQTDSQPGDVLSKQQPAALLTKPTEEPLVPVSRQADGFAVKAADGPSTQLSRPIDTHTSRPKVKSFIPATTEGPAHVKINLKANHTDEARQKPKSDISPSSWRKGQKLIRETLGAVKRTQVVQSEAIEPDSDNSVKKSSLTAAAVKAPEIRSSHSSASKNLQSSVNSRVTTPLIADSRSTEPRNSVDQSYLPGSIPEQPDNMDFHVLGDTQPASAADATSMSTSHHILALCDDGDGEEEMICTVDDDVHVGTVVPVEKPGGTGSQQTDSAVKQRGSHKRSLSPKSQPNKKPHQQHPHMDERSCKDSHRSCAYDKEEIQQYIRKKRQQQKQKKTQPNHSDRQHRTMAPLDTNLKRKSPASTNKITADSDKENRGGCDVTEDKTRIGKQQRANAETVHKELLTDESVQQTVENISNSGWNSAVPKSSSARFVASNSSHYTASCMASNVTATVGSRSQVAGDGLEMSDLSSHKRPNFFKIHDSLPVYNSGLSVTRSSPNTSILSRKLKLSLLAASLNSRLEEFSGTFAGQGSSVANQFTKQLVAKQHNSDSSSSTLTESQHSGYAEAIDCIYNLHSHHQNAAFASQSAELALQTRRPLLAHHVGNFAGVTAMQGPLVALNYSYMDDTSIEQDVDGEQHSRSKLAWKARPRGADDFYPQQTKDADRHQDQLSSGDSSHSQSSAIDDQQIQFSSPSRQELVRQMTKLDAKFLTAREKELHQRREKVETLLAWKLKLDVEEREIERLEKEVALLELHPDDSQSFVLSETMLSEHSDSESRIKALQEELKRKKVIVEQLKKEQRVKKTQELRRKDVELSKEIAVLQNSDKKRPLDSCSNPSGDLSQADVKSMQDSLKTDSQISRHRKPEPQRAADHQSVSAGSSKRELRLEPRTSAKHYGSAPADEMVIKSASIRKGSDSNDNENSDDTTLPSADLISEAHVASPERLDIVDFETTTDSFLVNAELAKGKPVSQSENVDVPPPAASTDAVSKNQEDDKSTSSTLPFVNASKESRPSKSADRTPSPSRSSKLPGPVNKLNTVKTGSVEPKVKSSESPVISSKSDSSAAKSPQVSGHSPSVKSSSLGPLGDDKKHSMAAEPVDGSHHQSLVSELPKQPDVIGSIGEQFSSSNAAEKSNSRNESPRSRDISDRSPDRSKLSISSSQSEQSAYRGKRSKSSDRSEHSVTSGKLPGSPDRSEQSPGSGQLSRSSGSSGETSSHHLQPVNNNAGLGTLDKRPDRSSEVSDLATGLKEAKADAVSSDSGSMSQRQKQSSKSSKLSGSKSGSGIDSVSESSSTVNYSEDFSTPSVCSKKGSMNKSAASKHSNLECPAKFTSDDNVVDECQETDEDISEDLVAAEISEADSVSCHKMALEKPDERVTAIPVDDGSLANSLNCPISSGGLKPTGPGEEKPGSSDDLRKQKLSQEMDPVMKSEHPACKFDVIADSVQHTKRHDTGDDVSDLSRYIERTEMIDEISLDNEQLPLEKFDNAAEFAGSVVSAGNGSGLVDSLGVSQSDSTTANNTDDLERLINMAAAAVESFASTGLSDFAEPFGNTANKNDASCDKTIDSTTKNLLMDAVDEMLSIRNSKLSETHHVHPINTSPVKQLDRSTASDSSDNQADDMQLSGSEEWIDDDFGVRPPPPPYSSVATNNVDISSPLEAVAAFTAQGQVGALSPAANAASQLVIGSFSVVPRTNDEILELVDKIIDAFWECRRYGERWDGKQPPADYFTPSESRSSTAEHVSQRVFKQLLLDLVTEILTDVFKREEEETPSTSDQQFFHMSGLVTSAVQQRCAVVEIPTTIDTLRPIVHKRVTSTLKMNNFIENQPSMKSLKWRVARKKHDHVDRLLIYELRQEEQHWISYTDEELDVKMQIADSIFELLISETIDTLRKVSLHRTC